MAKKQVTENQVEQLIEGIVDKMQKANELFLINIGNKIKKIKNLRPTEAHKLIQILKYGGNYEDMVKKITNIADMTTKEIDKIFESYSKKDLQFAEDFYKYRNIPLSEYSKNSELINQTKAFSNIAKNQMYDFTRSNVLGYTIRDNKGNEIFRGLRQVYNDLLDEAFVNVGQGKETFDSSIRSILRDIGQSGLKTINYKSGRAVRLDSSIRMHLRNRLGELHNENQILFGRQFDSDGVEISVHENPAPDHEEAQGRQFSNEEYQKLQNGNRAKDYKGNDYILDHDLNGSYRPISEMNCYHTIFSIILGVSEPEYSDQQLQNIINENNKGFKYENKRYTKYEGTQLQRRLETEIRKQKDIQILARASGDDTLVGEAQNKIQVLTNKYNELSEISGLPTKKRRLAVSGYHKLNRVSNTPSKPSVDLKYNAIVGQKTPKLAENEIFISKEEQIERLNYRKEYINEQIIKTERELDLIPEGNPNSRNDSLRKIYKRDLNNWKKKLQEINTDIVEDEIITLNTKEDCIKLLDRLNIGLKDKNLDKVDIKVLIDNSKQYYNIVNKYPFLNQTLQERGLVLEYGKTSGGGVIGEAMRTGYNITMNIDDFYNIDDVIYWAKYQTGNHYNMPCSKEYYSTYFQTHELGHVFDYRILKNVDWSGMEDMPIQEFYEKTNRTLIDSVFKRAKKDSGKSHSELLKQLSDYGKKDDEETLAELFANANSGKPNDLGKAFDKYMEELLK